VACKMRHGWTIVKNKSVMRTIWKIEAADFFYRLLLSSPVIKLHISKF
jgi:hypothetical protein